MQPFFKDKKNNTKTFSLKAIQDLFQDYLLTEEVTEEASLMAIIDGPVQMNSAPKNKRIKIYYEGYRWRLLDRLLKDYPKLTQLMGDKAFEAAARHYIDCYPSTEHSIRTFGQQFDSFLATHKPYSNTLYLSEMARFEWALGKAMDAKEGRSLNISALKQLPENTLNTLSMLRLKFHPSLQIIQCYWNVIQHWESVSETVETSNAPIPLAKMEQEHHWILWRQGTECFFRCLVPKEIPAFYGMKSNGTFADLCEILCHEMNEEDVPRFALNCLHQWINEGIVSNFTMQEGN